MPTRAGTVPLQVVACATPRGIVRAITHWTTAQEMIDEVLKAVGVLATETEWTGYTYEGLPYYIDDAYAVPSGVYLFPWRTPDRWNDPRHRISERDGQLLWRPRGWCEGRKPQEGEKS